jgi:Ca2+-binding EF-hand superfamily protein
MSGVALLAAGLALGTAWAGEMQVTDEVMAEFWMADKDRDGFLSGSEGLDYVGTSLNLDDLAFRAADIDGDGRLTPEEFARYVEASRAEEMPATPTDAK